MASSKTVPMTDELYSYILGHSTPPDTVQEGLIARTRESLGSTAVMQIPPEQGTFLTLLTKLVAPRFAVEVGTFTGYSALAIARGLPDGGRLLCCDVSEEWTRTAREAWLAAGVADRIELRIAPAIETLGGLVSSPHIDLAFVDADKGGYIGYWEALVPRMRPGGLILADNVLYGGDVVDPGRDSPAEAIHRFNEHVRADPRVEVVVLPIADGLTFARVRD
ncbi:O-methyltransferase [Yinghuangia sp. ASG 101]|uniref:O-methyltransferase n=1 Tax=Yinghuangia sp. ASG 101 TaxID=2896848 RepID=UPI001E61D127|nr:O-methyltransferase [Yinghuangia sp. ASG 101]UGQ10325.1 O-methyltransferase [Yinghuangia sp. ASG 101]